MFTSLYCDCVLDLDCKETKELKETKRNTSKKFEWKLLYFQHTVKPV